jgi:hypothetical protein
MRIKKKNPSFGVGSQFVSLSLPGDFLVAMVIVAKVDPHLA